MLNQILKVGFQWVKHKSVINSIYWLHPIQPAWVVEKKQKSKTKVIKPFADF